MEDIIDAFYTHIKRVCFVLFFLGKNNSQFNGNFIKNYNEESDKEYFLQVDVQYLKKLHELHNGLPLLPERMKIMKVQKFRTNLGDKTEYAIHIKNSKQALDHELVFKKVHREIKFNQNVWLKPYIVMNTDLRKKKKNDFENDFLKLMNKEVLEKSVEKKAKILMNEPVYLGICLLRTSVFVCKN